MYRSSLCIVFHLSSICNCGFFQICAPIFSTAGSAGRQCVRKVSVFVTPLGPLGIVPAPHPDTPRSPPCRRCQYEHSVGAITDRPPPQRGAAIRAQCALSETPLGGQPGIVPAPHPVTPRSPPCRRCQYEHSVGAITDRPPPQRGAAIRAQRALSVTPLGGQPGIVPAPHPPP